jgi:hypothetical protein
MIEISKENSSRLQGVKQLEEAEIEKQIQLN